MRRETNDRDYESSLDDEREVELDDEEIAPPPTLDPDERVEEFDDDDSGELRDA